MRVTWGMMLDNMLSGMNLSSAAMIRYQNQLATGKRVQKPSDDPAGVVRILSLRATLDQVETHLSNITQGQQWLAVTEAALGRDYEITVLRAIETIPVYAAIGDFVWNDLNGNGLMDMDEPGLSGSTLYLYDYEHSEPEPPVQPPVLTASDGQFEFMGVPPGRYRLVARHPPSYVASGPDAVTVLVSTGVSSVVNLGAWVPTSASPTLSPTPYASPTGTIVRPHRANLPLIRKR